MAVEAVVAATRWCVSSCGNEFNYHILSYHAYDTSVYDTIFVMRIIIS